MLFRVSADNKKIASEAFTVEHTPHVYGYKKSAVLIPKSKRITCYYQIDMLDNDNIVCTVRNKNIDCIIAVVCLSGYTPEKIEVESAELYKNCSNYAYRREYNDRYLKKYDQIACVVHGALSCGLLFDTTTPQEPATDMETLERLHADYIQQYKRMQETGNHDEIDHYNSIFYGWSKKHETFMAAFDELCKGDDTHGNTCRAALIVAILRGNYYTGENTPATITGETTPENIQQTTETAETAETTPATATERPETITRGNNTTTPKTSPQGATERPTGGESRRPSAGVLLREFSPAVRGSVAVSVGVFSRYWFPVSRSIGSTSNRERHKPRHAFKIAPQRTKTAQAYTTTTARNKTPSRGSPCFLRFQTDFGVENHRRFH